MSGGALTHVLLRFAAQFVGHLRGGLGYANVLSLTLFSGISGSALADAAGPGSMMVKMMDKAGYARSYAAALTASTAIVGPIIPPSVSMIIYALQDENVSEARLPLHRAAPRRPHDVDQQLQGDSRADADRAHRGGHPLRHLHAHRGVGGGRVLRPGLRQVGVPHAAVVGAAGHCGALGHADGLGAAGDGDFGRLCLGADGGGHSAVVAGLELRHGHQGLAADLVERVLHLGGAVGRVDVDQHQADLGRGQLHQHPFGVVVRPDADAVALVQPQAQQRAGQAARLGVQAGIAVAQALVAADQGLAIGLAGRHVGKEIADGLLDQRHIGAALGMAGSERGVLGGHALSPVSSAAPGTGKCSGLPRHGSYCVAA
uniref:Predicted protein n=1 Tax=Physcomitrium patens TaxID=3218 RepID=A9U7B9_PHYPA